MTAFSAISSAPRIRIIKFTSPTCSVCKSLERNGFYDDLKKAHPDVAIVECSVETPDSPADKYSTLHDVKGLPTFLFEVEHFGVVDTVEGADAKKQTLKLFDKVIEECRNVSKTMHEVGAPKW